MEASGQFHAPAALIPRKSPGTHSVGGWVGPTLRLDVSEKRSFAPKGIRILHFPAGSVDGIPTTQGPFSSPDQLI
jgi:hypothetical protein